MDISLFFLSQCLTKAEKGKTEKLLDGHGKQIQAGAALRTNEDPYPADEEEGEKGVLLFLSLFHMYRSKLT